MSKKRMIHFKNEENGIEVSIPDGGMLRLFSENGDAQCVLCRYIDENHTEIDGVRVLDLINMHKSHCYKRDFDPYHRLSLM